MDRGGGRGCSKLDNSSHDLHAPGLVDSGNLEKVHGNQWKQPKHSARIKSHRTTFIVAPLNGTGAGKVRELHSLDCVGFLELETL
ncbi:hypothetical protein PGT21_024196 [Puccinia graminis f. sp. tritici]|uniref:Uncharacterized protein n=1 Tax=Puccinia graminis f. sp. tritici TaxID=56615 RepID=A0A5B0R1K3_PUCGR|nr:hypothetical protein PGTUg99_011529 [Puccinia graminis f. sp. tritici]KAA1119396.1 hypothetical protein PGT21_024196 [Puccinia graminis f. sp. tritici]